MEPERDRLKDTSLLLRLLPHLPCNCVRWLDLEISYLFFLVMRKVGSEKVNYLSRLQN